MPSQLPVTVLSGFLGAGKSTLLSHLINKSEDLRLAVIVNDMSEINIDASLLKIRESRLTRGEERLVEMQNGCICCTLREDLLVEIRKLAREGRFDYLLIESSGISEPLAVAETFAFEDEEGVTLGEAARLDTLVTIVDAANFMKSFASSLMLKEMDMAANEEDERGLAELLTEQIEFANVILINKIDLVKESDLRIIETLVRKLNPAAKIIRTQNARVETAEILNTSLFDLETASQAPGWMAELRGEKIPETEEYGISSLAFRARRPFHPERLADFINSGMEDILRSKGFFWLASRHDDCGIWSQAGPFLNMEYAGRWAAAIDDPDYQHSEEDLDEWLEPWGDRRQELVFIGMKLDREALEKTLDQLLLTESEMELGPDHWADLPDPLPEWEDPLLDELLDEDGEDS